MTSAAEQRTTLVGSPSRAYRIAKIAVVAVVVLLGIGAALLVAKWPFTRDNIAAQLGDAASSTVRIKTFKTIYLPPGCVMEEVEFSRSGAADSPPLMTVRRLTITANYLGLFHNRISSMHLEDVHVDGAQRKENGASSESNHSEANSTAVGEIIVDRAVLDFPRKQKPPLRFDIHQLTFANVVPGKRISFHATLDNPLPPGRVRVDGQFGPWNDSDVAQTPLSGAYQFSDANLATLGGIAGILSSQGSFDGPAAALRVQGKTDTPDYRVNKANHPVHLKTEFQAVVDCRNGNVELQGIRVQFEKTAAAVQGEVVKKPGGAPRTASLSAADPGRKDRRLVAPFVKRPDTRNDGAHVIPGAPHDSWRSPAVHQESAPSRGFWNHRRDIHAPTIRKKKSTISASGHRARKSPTTTTKILRKPFRTCGGRSSSSTVSFILRICRSRFQVLPPACTAPTA